MIKINKNYKEYKNGVKPVYEEPKRIYYKVDSNYREVFTVFESKALYNLDIAKRNMVEQEKKNRFIISEISKLNSNITGKDQYDNDVPLAAPHKQRYKPSYTLIPLASSGYYDISQNDLVDLETEAKKNINLPVLNDTRAMSNLTNFKITL